MNEKKLNTREVYPTTSKVDNQFNASQPANYKAIPPISTIHSGIAANHLFSLFTADIIRQDVIFIR